MFKKLATVRPFQSGRMAPARASAFSSTHSNDNRSGFRRPADQRARQKPALVCVIGSRRAASSNAVGPLQPTRTRRETMRSRARPNHSCHRAGTRSARPNEEGHRGRRT